jgi:hypothetical protein
MMMPQEIEDEVPWRASSMTTWVTPGITRRAVMAVIPQWSPG